MMDVEEIASVIRNATEAINATSEAKKLLLSAHKNVADYTYLKTKYIFDKSSAIEAFTVEFTKNYVDRCEERAKPHYDRAKAGMSAAEKLCAQLESLTQEYGKSFDKIRRQRIDKMIKMKQMELEQCLKLQEVAGKMAQEDIDKISSIEPLISKAWRSAKNNFNKSSGLINFSIKVSIQENILRFLPVITALAITIFIDSLTGPFEDFIKPIDARGYHNSAILILFAIQWIFFDKAKEVVQEKLNRRAIANIAKTFSENVDAIKAIESDLAAAEEICMSLEVSGGVSP